MIVNPEQKCAILFFFRFSRQGGFKVGPVIKGRKVLFPLKLELLVGKWFGKVLPGVEFMGFPGGDSFIMDRASIKRCLNGGTTYRTGKFTGWFCG